MNEKKFINHSGQYHLSSLDEKDLMSNPMDQFKQWFEDICNQGQEHPEAVNIATINAQGRISSRVVLMKKIEDDGIIFFTNYNSQKAKEMDAHPQIAATFFWGSQEKQVRMEGKVSRISRQESQAYFETRPRGSQIGAWVSKQSDQVTSRLQMEETLAEFEKELEDKQVSLPPFWGGYKLVIDKIEFWQGRPSRLHDRLVYELVNSTWEIKRLWP